MGIVIVAVGIWQNVKVLVVVVLVVANAGVFCKQQNIDEIDRKKK